MRPTWANINLNSLRSNFAQLKGLLGKGVDIMSVVKADAYGHGAVPISRELVRLGANMLGVATVDEAMELRESGIESLIVLLGGIQVDEAPMVVDNDFLPVVYSLDLAKALNKYASVKNKVVKYHLKLDTGMNRLGVSGDDLSDLLDELSGLDCIIMDGILTHLANADLEDDNYTEKQIDNFSAMSNMIKKAGHRPKYLHVANSAAIQRYPQTHFNLVRPGIMLYGSSTVLSPSVSTSSLSPVMKLISRIIQINKVPQGAKISYGGTFITEKPSILAILPIGYADGYVRALSNKARVSVNDKPAPVVGAVCMDLTIIDITDIPGVKVGDEVVLFGDDIIGIDEVASWAGTISYELLSITGKRVPRKYLENT